MIAVGTIFGMPYQIDLFDKKARCVGFYSPRFAVRHPDSQGRQVEIGPPGEVQLKGNHLFVGSWRKAAVFETVLPLMVALKPGILQCKIQMVIFKL